MNPSLLVTANLFRIETKDEIFYNPYSFANENLDGHSIRQGIELSVKQRVRSVLLTGSYTYRDSEIDGGQFDGNNVPNVPQHQLTLGMQTDIFHNVQLNLDGNYIGKRQFISDFDNSHDKQDEYYYLTGKLTYLLARGSVYLAVKNLLDQKYSEYGVIDWAGEKNFYPSPGINFQLGANWQF